MELRTSAGRLRAGDIFKLVAIGYAVGVGVIFVPLFLLIFSLAMATGELSRAAGNAGPGALSYVTPLIMLPFIVVMQAVMIGGMVTLGLWLYQTRRPIRLVADDAAPPPT